MVLASGTRASIRFTPEGTTRNETPSAIGTPYAVSSVGHASGLTTFTCAAGVLAAGFAAGQTVYVDADGSDGTGSGNFVVQAVTDTTIVIYDSGDTSGSFGASSEVEIKMKTLRTTGRNINLEKDTLESAEVNPDGQQSDVRHGFNRVVGSPGYELSLRDFNEWLELALGGQWETATLSGTPAPAAGSISGLTNPAEDGVRAGDVIRVSGSSDADNNGDWLVTVVGATTLTVIPADPSANAMPGGGTGHTVTWQGARLDLTTGIKTMTVERAFDDLPQYQVFNGVACDGTQISISPESIVTGTTNLLGMSAAAMSGTPVDATPVDATRPSPFAAFDGGIWEGGSSIAVVTSLEFTINRNRSLNPVVGSKFSPDVFEGTANVTGTVSAYFENATLFNKFVNETESSIFVRLEDPANSNNYMQLALYRVKYNGGNMDPPQEGPIVIEMPFQALLSTGLNDITSGAAGTNTTLSFLRSDSLY